VFSVDCAAPKSLLWWMARHCVRLLTALAIFAAALGATAPASANPAPASPAPAVRTTASAEHVAPKQVCVETPDTVLPAPEPVTVVAVHREPAEQASAYLGAMGQRAPPVG
jgi:hypothetical protein